MSPCEEQGGHVGKWVAAALAFCALLVGGVSRRSLVRHGGERG